MYNLETRGGDPAYATWASGRMVTGNIAATFWDLYDSHADPSTTRDTGISYAFKTYILNVLRSGTKYHTIDEYATGWKSAPYSYSAPHICNVAKLNTATLTVVSC
jgi:hypothetical protein